MRRTHPTLIAAVEDWNNTDPSTRLSARANAVNLSHDDRIASVRELTLAAAVDRARGTKPSDWGSLCKGYSRYKDEALDWDGSNEVPEPFTAANDGAALGAAPAEWRELVRVLRIGRALAKSPGMNLSDLQLAVRTRRTPKGEATAMDRAAADAIVRKFVAALNTMSHRMPSFAGLLNDVRAEADRETWPDDLRARFGLGFLSPGPDGVAVPVAQLRYTVDALYRRRRPSGLPTEAMVRVPTWLETNFYDYFFPAPTSQYYGRTMDLRGAPHTARLTCEVVHFPVNIEPEDIWDIGLIDTPIPRAHELATVRDEHLAALRTEFACPDFAETM